MAHLDNESRKIKSATAVYTGGGIYIFYGVLADSTYFLMDDETPTVYILNAPYDHNNDSCDTWEWIEEHLIFEYSESKESCNFCIEILEKVLVDGHTPESNFADGDIIKRIEKLKNE